MKKHRHFVLIAIAAIVFLSFGCAALPPVRIAESELPTVAVPPEKPMRYKSEHPDGFYYEGILDIAVVVNGDWGEPIWTNTAYMPLMELYYKNPTPGAEPQYAGIAGGRSGIVGYYYMVGDEFHAFLFSAMDSAFIEVHPSAEARRQGIEDFATAVGQYRKQGT